MSGSDDIATVIKDNLPVAVAVAGAVVASAYFLLSGGDQKSVKKTDGGETTKTKRKRKKKNKSTAKAKEVEEVEEVEEHDDSSSDTEEEEEEKEKAETPQATESASSKKKKKQKAKAKAKKASGSTDEEPVAAAAEVKKVAKPKAPKAAKLGDAFNDGFTPKIKQVEEKWESVSSKVKTKVKKPKGEVLPGMEQAQYGKPIASDSRKIELRIPAAKVGLLIGPGGVTLKKFQETFDTKIDIPKTAGGDTGYLSRTAETSVFIEGSGASPQQCKAEIHALMTKGYCNTLNPGFTEGSVEMHSDFFHLLIGPAGKTLRTIESKMDVTINIPTRSSIIGNKPQWVKIAGKKDAIEKVKADLKQMMKIYFSQIAEPSMKYLEIDMPLANYKAIIGVRGQTIKSIQGNTKCSINIPRANARTKMVVLVGPSDSAIQTCKAQIDKAIERYTAETGRKLEDEHYEDVDDGTDDDDDEYARQYRRPQHTEPQQQQQQQQPAQVEEWGGGGSEGW